MTVQVRYSGHQPFRANSSIPEILPRRFQPAAFPKSAMTIQVHHSGHQPTLPCTLQYSRNPSAAFPKSAMTVQVRYSGHQPTLPCKFQYSRNLSAAFPTRGVSKICDDRTSPLFRTSLAFAIYARRLSRCTSQQIFFLTSKNNNNSRTTCTTGTPRNSSTTIHRQTRQQTTQPGNFFSRFHDLFIQFNAVRHQTGGLRKDLELFPLA